MSTSLNLSYKQAKKIYLPDYFWSELFLFFFLHSLPNKFWSSIVAESRAGLSFFWRRFWYFFCERTLFAMGKSRQTFYSLSIYFRYLSDINLTLTENIEINIDKMVFKKVLEIGKWTVKDAIYIMESQSCEFRSFEIKKLNT